MTAEARPVATGGGGAPADLPAAVRVQILATEHWGLLATRSLSWTESFSRAGMFLASLSAAVVALALVAQASQFGDAFIAFALVVLPFVLFIGLATHARLVAANVEDLYWVLGMNRLRHAYLELAPELEPYFITSAHDDPRGVLLSIGARPELSSPTASLLHALVTTPGMIAVINAMVGAVIVSKDGTIVGQGYHEMAGGPHAEVCALDEAGDLARGVLLAVQLWYQGRSYGDLEDRFGPVRFPSPTVPGDR